MSRKHVQISVKGSNPFLSFVFIKKKFSFEYFSGSFSIFNEKILKKLLLIKIKKVFVTFSPKRDFYSSIKNSIILSKIGFSVITHISYSTNSRIFFRYCLLLKTNKIDGLFLLKGDKKKISKNSITKILIARAFFKNIYSAIYPDFHKKTINFSFEKKRIKKKKSVGVSKFVTQVTMDLFSLSDIKENFSIEKENVYIGVFVFRKIKEIFFFYKICKIKLPFFFIKNFTLFFKKKKNFFYEVNFTFLKILRFIGFKRFHLYSINIKEVLDFTIFLKNEKNWLNRV
ncbi:methylenetetrahydrofolate reductase [Candidatus Vidania fulgoroideae]|nr:methylenetetrahydrofolate reductase [Candidatus Vidania fulgoroideae]